MLEFPVNFVALRKSYKYIDILPLQELYRLIQPGTFSNNCDMLDSRFAMRIVQNNISKKADKKQNI